MPSTTTGDDRHLLGHGPEAPALALWAPVALSVFLSWAAGFAIQREPNGQALLGLRVESFKLADGDIEDGLRLLRDKDPFKILIGFEKLPHREGHKDRKLSVEQASGTVGEILKRLCKADARYDFEVVQGVLIHVFPKGARGDPRDLLNMKISRFEIHDKILPQNLIYQISGTAPELKDYLDARAEGWARKKGRTLGYPGSIMSGNGSLPEVNVDLKDVTVRQILDHAAMLSLELSKGGRAYGWSPTGWKYEFVIDPDAPTGLGGYPRWTTF